MGRLFEELDYRATPIGMLSLRRRHEPVVGHEVYEVKLDDDFLMSSLFTASETALADLAIAKLEDVDLDILVGGLGLGYTANAVLLHRSVRSLLVVELLAPVIEWHEDELLPASSRLQKDSRCRLLEGDFFALAESAEGFDNCRVGRRFHAILLDIDHTPESLLDERSRGFYKAAGLERLSRHLLPGGIFALWSNDRPDADFTGRLSSVFAEAWSEAVAFENPYRADPTIQTVYLARAHSQS